ncbi:hypothetical protein V8G69_06805 [Gaetbulibacter sp. M235]|uniref:hypothetical protein n=1 Tax=Gaetbulibacter sp. M235 TaxID=3126510 RepID=UPI00374E97BD
MEEDIVTKLLECSICKTTLDSGSVYCSNCGFPENGTEKEIAIFHANKVIENRKIKDADDKIKSARNTLYVMSGISLVFGVILFFSMNDVSILITNVVLSIIYLVLAFWSSQKPLMALLLGLLLYLTTIIISAVVNPTTIIKGFLWKILIIAYLGKGIYSASAIKKQ